MDFTNNNQHDYYCLYADWIISKEHAIILTHNLQ